MREQSTRRGAAPLWAGAQKKEWRRQETPLSEAVAILMQQHLSHKALTEKRVHHLSPSDNRMAFAWPFVLDAGSLTDGWWPSSS